MERSQRRNSVEQAIELPEHVLRVSSDEIAQHEPKNEMLST